MSVNRVILVGNLGADPEVRNTAGGRAVCNLSLATNEVYKDKEGVRQEKTEWHRIAVWGPDAENCGKYLRKGSTIYVEGKLQTRSYEKDGVTRYSTDVVSERVVFLDGKKREGGGEATRERGGNPRAWGGDPVDRSGGPDRVHGSIGTDNDGGDDIPY